VKIIEKPPAEDNEDLKFFLGKSEKKGMIVKSEVLGGGLKLEEGLIKFEYTNRFSLRVINHQFGFKQSLESFIN